jgi:type VI secretion system protein ImpA
MVDLENLAEPLLSWDGLLQPIAGESPSGPSLRNEAPYEAIREALRPPDTAPGGVWQRDQKPTDYAAVIKMASAFLATRSKDLDVAIWLSEALTRKHHLAGLCEGLLLVRKLLETFWDTIHPALDPEDGEAFRARPIKHLNKVFVAAFLQFPITADGRTVYEYNASRSDGTPPVEEIDRAVDDTPIGFYNHLSEQIVEARQAVTLLRKTCDEKFLTSDRPYLERLLEQIDGLNNTVKSLVRSKPAPAAVAPPEAPVPPPAASPAWPATTRPPAPPPSPPAAVAPPEVTVYDLAAALRRDDASNPVPYMLVRSWCFGPMLAHGSPVSEDSLEPPPTELKTALRRAYLHQDWFEVLEQTERAMQLPCGSCWLDAQQYSYRACKELVYEGAANAIRGMLAGYLQALPDLVSSVMLDGSPAASPDTVAWLHSEVLVDPRQSRKESLDEVRSIDFDKPREVSEGAPPDAFEVAAGELNAGRFSEAFRVLAEALAKELSGRGRMQRKVQLAKISVEAGQHRIALPILREIYQTIEERRLDSWEAADLIAPPLAMLYRCLETLGDTGDFKQHLYEKLCSVDPIKALELTEKP